MATRVVTFNGTRLNDADANTNWGNFVIGGGAPASEFPLAYQVTSGTTTGAVNKKITSTSARQGVDYVHGSGTDMTAAANRLWFCKVYVSDSFDLNATWGVEVAMGSADTNNDHRYCIAGTDRNLAVYDQYPAQGGYIITAIDPNIDTWRESENGTFAQNSVLWFAVGAQFVNGTAKAENVAMDSIDIGTGLTITNGDGASTEGNFTDFVAEDQDIKTARWGVVTGSGDSVIVNGLLTIGSATVTEFLDTTSVLTYPDGYHSRGLKGVAVALSNASTIINEGALHIGNGTRNGVDAEDTRPDYIVTGTTATSADFTHTLRNFRDVTYTSACDVTAFDIECHLLTQASCNIDNGTVRTNALTNVACLQDPTFGTSTDLHDVEFVQAAGGAGHAIEALATGTLTNIGFTGYGGTPGSNLVANSGASDAAIFNDTGGAITLTISGTGDIPSVRNGASATTTIVSGTVPVTINVKDVDGGNLQNARVFLETSETVASGEEFEGAASTLTQAAGTATFTASAVHGLETGDLVVIRGAQPDGYNKVATATVTSTTVFTYPVDSGLSSPATASPVVSYVAIHELTDANGDAAVTRAFAVDQGFKGWARLKNTVSPFYKDADLNFTVDKDNGNTVNVVLQPDE